MMDRSGIHRCGWSWATREPRRESIHGQRALREEYHSRAARQVVGLEISGGRMYENLRLRAIGALVASHGLSAGHHQARPTTTSLVAVVLKTDDGSGDDRSRPYCSIKGCRLQFEVTVEAVRHRVGATIVKTPFLNRKRKYIVAVVGFGAETMVKITGSGIRPEPRAKNRWNPEPRNLRTREP